MHLFALNEETYFSNAALLPPLRYIVPKPGRPVALPTHPSFTPLFNKYTKFCDKKKPLQNTTVLLFFDKIVEIIYIFFSHYAVKKLATHLVISSNLRLTSDRLLHCSVTRAVCCRDDQVKLKVVCRQYAVVGRVGGDSKKD